MLSLRMRTIVWMLEQWGVWSRSGVFYGADSTLGDLQRKSGMPCLITDEEGLFIDGVIAQLKQRDERAALVIHYRYYDKLKFTQIAQKLGMSISSTDALIKRAECWVDAYIVAAIQHAA